MNNQKTKKVILNIMWVILAVVVGIPTIFFGLGSLVGALVYHLLTEDGSYLESMIFTMLCEGAWLIFMCFWLGQ